jgi:hypothetical protein
MSGKIKSTIELAMEKAARLPRLTEEEIRQRREEEYAPRGRAIAERFLTGDLSETGLDVELGRYPDEQGETVRRTFLETMCGSIDLEDAETSARAFEGIAVLVRDEHLEEASRRSSGIAREYQEQREREFAKAEEAESGSLRDLGVSGSAIRLNMAHSQRWREKRNELLQRFRPWLEEIQRALSDHVLRVISRA